jgi:branched-subunit amino acid ABC-type transport system permease component
VALHYFLTRSRTGRAMRAVADDPELAAVAGLDTEKVIRWTWIIGASLAAVAGVFAGMDTDVHPNLGWNLLLPMFAATILGGIGKPMSDGGGIIIGLAEELSTYNWIGESLADLLLQDRHGLHHGGAVDLPPQGLFRGRLL